MKDITFRLVITVAAIVLFLYLLYPSFQDYQNTKKITEQVDKKKSELLKTSPQLKPEALKKVLANFEDSLKANDQNFRSARAKRIKLGLDLQGGMRLVMEVNTAKLLEKLPEKPDDVYRQIIAEANKETERTNEAIVDIVVRKLKERGIRVSRYFGSVRDDEDKIISNLRKQTEDAVTRAIEIIRNRVDQYGVSEPSIQRQGERRIVIELPGVAREEEAKQLLQGTALLEFKLLKDPELAFNVMKRIDEILAGKTLVDSAATDSTGNDSTMASADAAKSKKDSAAAADTNKQLTKEEFAKKHPFFAIAQTDGRSTELYVQANNKDRLMRILNRADIRRVIPNNMQFVFSAKPYTKDRETGQDIFLLYTVNKAPELTGGVVTNAMATVDQTTSSPVVTMEMNSQGAIDWARITGANIKKRCAIILDDVVFSAPVIQNKITGGHSQITGMANMDEAKILEIVLKAGALPAPVDILEQRTVGPSLGQDSINKGLDSMVFGYIVVGLFMIVYYRRSGSVAAVGLLVTIIAILGLLAGFKATLTLPGIAGIVLIMGMAVDSNVLINERIREELASGKTLRAAVDNGYSRALSAIIDTHVTTMITGLILYQFGTGPVQGFALTLMIGIVTSLFSVLIVCHMMMDYMLNKGYKITV